MGRSSSHAVFAVFVLACALNHRVHAQDADKTAYPDKEVEGWADDASASISNTSAEGLSNVGKAFTALTSCSSASARSYGGYAVSWSNTNAKATQKAVVKCADAVSDAMGVTSTGACQSNNVVAIMSAAAEVCARSAIKLRSLSLATACASGKAIATARSCGFSAAITSSYARAIATAMAGAVSRQGATCKAFGGAKGEARITAAARSLTSGMAGSFAYAAAKYGGDAAVASRGMLYADVTTFAKVIAQLAAYTCADCRTTADCAMCTQGLRNGDPLGEASQATTDAVGIAAGGKYALASAMSDALNSLCTNRTTIQASITATLEAAGCVVTQIIAKANRWTDSRGTAVACSGSFAKGSNLAVADTIAEVVMDAAALAVEADECATRALAPISANLFANFTMVHVARAVQKQCSVGGKVTLDYNKAGAKLFERRDISEAFSTAFATVVSECDCSGAGYCCNCREQTEDTCHW